MIQTRRLNKQKEILDQCFKNYNEQHYNHLWERDSFKSKKHTNYNPLESDSEDESDSYYDVTNCNNNIHKNQLSFLMIFHLQVRIIQGRFVGMNMWKKVIHKNI